MRVLLMGFDDWSPSVLFKDIILSHNIIKGLKSNL